MRDMRAETAATWTVATVTIAVLTVIGCGGPEPRAATSALEYGVAPDTSAAIAVDPQALPTHESGLPIIHLWVSPELNADDYTRATVVAEGRTETAKAKLRGSSSREYPKKSFTVK